MTNGILLTQMQNRNMLTQLTTPIPLKTPKGAAWAVAIIDYGPQWDLQWVTFICDSGECWTFRNNQIRQEQNYTFGLPAPTSIKKLPMNGKTQRPSEDAALRSLSASSHSSLKRA